jgi:hypothetical protein
MEREEPILPIPYRESELPMRAKLLKLHAELHWMKSRTEKLEPNLANPNTEIEDPIRQRPRREMELPK